MNKKYFIPFLTFLIAATASLTASPLTKDITHEIPEIEMGNFDGYQKISDVAQYKNADWNNVIGIARNITVQEAKSIADNNPEVTFFFYTKGYQMVLEKEDDTYRLFRHGDTVFFSSEPWWGSAAGLADGYIKQ